MALGSEELDRSHGDEADVQEEPQGPGIAGGDGGDERVRVPEFVIDPPQGGGEQFAPRCRPFGLQPDLG
ncbi:MAG: hypothetical protein BWY91_01016 [bacterium ADurb.BinA028]|nr:MAG: hypothetical protein BWY91_01016 [bacterium ADurb.BinA028]